MAIELHGHIQFQAGRDIADCHIGTVLFVRPWLMSAGGPIRR
jgi:hypothetical protein